MSLVSVAVIDEVALVTLDNPPVSTGNAALRADLFEALESLHGRADVRAVVLASAQKHFYSGSDISEFDGVINSPTLPDVIDRIERLPVPVVAALQGLTLGGGLEFALASDYRVAAEGARLGLPEVTLGMLPGAGGTVRLPRLVGVPQAARMIGSGQVITAQSALAVGLIDSMVPQEELLPAAREAARRIPKRRTSALPVPHATAEDVREARAESTKQGRARPNVVRAVDLVISGALTDAASALAAERAAFDELRVSPEARNLRYQFFAQKAAAKALTSGITPHTPSRVGVVGAGTMGQKIAAAFLARGVTVILCEVAEAVRGRALSALEGQGAEATPWGALSVTGAMEDLANCEIVIDAVFEDMAVKQGLLRELEEVLPPKTTIASNTSYLDLDEMGSVLRDPARFVGLHFFNPADRNKLLEVVRARQTGARALTLCAGVARLLGKTAILARVGEGFVANRVYADYRGQAEYLVEDGASPRQVDEAMCALGFPIGPFAVADMSGLDIAWARRKRLRADRNPEQRYVTIADTLCELGRLGKKVGKGWYRYDADFPRGGDDPQVALVIDAAREARGGAPQRFSAEEIQQRILCAMLVAAAELVATGVAGRASDIDVAMVAGFAFPAWLGGPIRFSAQQDPEWLIQGLSAIYEADPIGYAVAADAKLHGQVPAVIDSLLASVR